MHRRIPILLYHSISAEASDRFRRWVVHPRQFAEHMLYLVLNGYHPVTISELVGAMSRPEASLPGKPVAITFDDGFADFHGQALPTLEHHGLACTLYVATGFIGGTARWLVRQGESRRSMLTWSQIREAVTHGVECGAHSHTHRRLDELPTAAAEEEIVSSKASLEDHIGFPVTTFAYPHGYSGPRVRDLVATAGFSSATAVRHAMSSPRDDVFGLARIIIGNDTDVRTLERLLNGWGIARAPLSEPLRAVAWRAARRTARAITHGGR